MSDHRKTPTKLLTLFVLSLFIATAFAGCFGDDDDETKVNYEGQELIDSYSLYIQEPQNEEEMLLASVITASLTLTNETYHPMFILEDGKLDSHQLHTIAASANRYSAKYLFSSTNTSDEIGSQLSSVDVDAEIMYVPFTMEAVNTLLRNFTAYEDDVQFTGEITVASYRESLWAAPLAALEQKCVTIGKASFENQEEVWQELSSGGITPDYVVVTNPDDYLGADVFYTLFTPDNGETWNNSYHIPTLSIVAPALAAYYKGYVITDIPPLEEIVIPSEYTPFFPDHDPANRDLNDPANDMYKNNVIGYGYYEHLKYINTAYGPIEHIALVGSAETLPQFELYDFSGSEPDYTSSDVVYGFLDVDDLYTMTAAVGRIINYNVQGASNMIARTLGYDYLDPYIDSSSLASYQSDVKWTEHTSSWNGFEVADLRGQNTPGLYFLEDSHDEGYEGSYWTTTGVGGGYSVAGGVNANPDIDEELSVSGLVAYRGHGSWHASFYQWGYYPLPLVGMGDDGLGHVEGEHCRDLYLPPQTAILVSCENAKVHGSNYGGSPIDMDRLWATNYLYGGAIGLCAATEVSYSNIGQDASSGSGAATQDYNWDINDLWYAGFWDNTLNGRYDEGEHHEEETTGGHAVRLTENRYIDNLREDFDGKTCTPFYEPPDNMIHPERGPVYGDEGGMHWKEVSMFAYYGDPAFNYHRLPGFEGENLVNRWH